MRSCPGFKSSYFLSRMGSLKSGHPLMPSSEENYSVSSRVGLREPDNADRAPRRDDGLGSDGVPSVGTAIGLINRVICDWWLYLHTQLPGDPEKIAR